MKKGSGRQIRKAVIILFWLMVWQAAAAWTDNQILLAGPRQVLDAFVENIMRPDFFTVILHSSARIGLGFFLAFFAGAALGAASCRFPLMEEVLAPVMAALKSIPVASFVVLLLIWFGSGRLSFFISFLIVFPNVYVNTAAGLKSTDDKLLEMARVFGMGGGNKFLYLYRPALVPYLDSCLKVSLGMSWKSGVAAEIIGLPEASLGERLYMSKIYLDTAGMFAWTVTIVLVSFLFEKMVLWLFRRFADWRPYPFPIPGADRTSWNMPGSEESGKTGTEVRLLHIDKSYDGKPVLQDFHLAMKAGGRYLLMAPSGAGKTTLLRMMAKLMKPTGGQVSIRIDGTKILDEIEIKRHIGYLSNNTKLYGRLSTRELLQMLGTIYGMTQEDTERKIEEISTVMSMESFIDNRIEKLSTGQTQRASIARCLIHDPQVYIFDEPTLGLDIISSASIVEFMKGERERGKTVLYSTHYMEEAEYLCDRIVMIHRGRIISEGTPAALKEQTGKSSLRDVFSGLIREEDRGQSGKGFSKEGRENAY